ncbi:MAG TPA: SDR family NAD(P)-dependent oxidoreductase [Acidocella sp.]|jgi:short-subunit dehydrogenase|uniref:SDR family NAD(P)-dependent oxidoreductase n=1 Tax=Acidocella sp. TaxID=50710 RepID=UPI002CAF2119|nr:SDR family NAD(P)-dependent oxidoreductase [Acidocella sp.]HVE21668.1 SDR family NAD(P)-dependent oxidoreductase [Acidocella sp.]
MSQPTKNTALITGASTGIGAVYAKRLAARGYNLVLVARDTARLQALASTLEQAGAKAAILPADLTRREDRAAVERRLEADATITMLVNNAGMAMNGPLASNDPDVLERMIELNVTAATRLAAAAARAFSTRRSGTIINIASVLALAPEQFNGPYSATKAFVLALTQSMRQELGPLGIQVQAVLPGATRTEIWERAGMNISNLPAEMVMDVEEMVDAALSGLDQNEAVTIPSLPDIADWQKLTEARFALGPNLSRQHAAARYGRA